MKKIYTLAIALFGVFAFGQNGVVITTIVDGTLPADGCSGTAGTASPKFVELYVFGTVNFAGYRVQTESNGPIPNPPPGTEPLSWTGVSLENLGTITDAFVYLVFRSSDSDIIFEDMYPNITTNVLKSGAMPNGNGNDAVRIIDGDDNVLDQFADPWDVSGSNDFSAVWSYRDGYAKRNNDVAPNGGNFDPATFTYGKEVFLAPNNNCEYIIETINIGSFTIDDAVVASVNENNIAGLSVYPNPVTGNVLHITSNNNVEKSVAIFDVLGKQIISAKTINGTVNITNLNAGVYILKVTEQGKTATKKLVVR